MVSSFGERRLLYRLSLWVNLSEKYFSSVTLIISSQALLQECLLAEKYNNNIIDSYNSFIPKLREVYLKFFSPN